MDTRTVDPQLPLFPKDRVSELARAHLDTAWVILQHRLYLSESAVAEQYCLLAHQRELLVMRTWGERQARDAASALVQRPRYGPQARPVQPPTIARLAG